MILISISGGVLILAGVSYGIGYYNGRYSQALEAIKSIDPTVNSS